jgi:AcrR family transcriptional regulator
MTQHAMTRDEDAPARRGRPRSVATTRAILESAYRLMATTSAAATTIEAIARHSSVSKMTIYKWWPSREALLIDAFLDHASAMLPLTGDGPALPRVVGHAERYAAALLEDFGHVQLAVISECIASAGSAELFHERYIGIRRGAIAAIIAEGQRGGSITTTAGPEMLFDAIYGSLFYRYVFRIAPLTPAYARELAEFVLAPR